MQREMMRAFLFFALIANSAFADPLYMGNSKDGYAIQPAQAVNKASPHLYQSYKLRNANPPKSEEEFWQMDYLRTHVLVEGKYYLVVRDLPKKFPAQYEKHAVRVHKYTGAVEPLQ